MIVIVIVGGMFIGYIIGQYIVDRWINTNHRDIDSKNHDKK